VKAITKARRDHVRGQSSAFWQSRQTINLSNNWLSVIGWEETISKSLLFFILTYVCLIFFIYD